MLLKKSGYPWLGVQAQMLYQVRRQMAAAGDRPIEWHFAEKEVADNIRTFLEKNDVYVKVVYTPYIPRQR